MIDSSGFPAKEKTITGQHGYPVFNIVSCSDLLRNIYMILLAFATLKGSDMIHLAVYIELYNDFNDHV
jgi:hypothetical protein